MAERPHHASTSTGWTFYAGWIGAAIVAVAALAGLVFARGSWVSHQTAQLTHQAEEGPVVLVVPVERSPQNHTVVYPGDVHGYYESPVYPKVSGYVKVILVDKGSRVKKGQLLAVIESPELDQQVINARGSYQIAAITDKRNQALVGSRVIAQQIADESHATLISTHAAYQSLLAEQGYERVTAPFEGVITARNVDPGALVALQTAQQSAVPIVAIARLKPVRVYINLPQEDAAFVRDGDPAAITVSQLPGRKLIGSVTRHPEALTSATRTMLVEVDLPNDDLALLPGMYAHVEITLSGSAGAPLVRDDALIFNNGKVFVPVVRDNRVHMVEVRLGMDDGIQSEVVEGLDGGEIVALNLGQSAADGEVVRPRRAAATSMK
ncbi:MAG: efflux RND transporter periplasmic adaptor subunit [Candidatus Binataceae bacterium]